MTHETMVQLFFQPVLALDVGLSLMKLLLFFSSLWLIFLILIQRGKGGGLTAAFGGGGGDSAFGAKAGDAFTKITIISALVWITLCMVTIASYNPPESANRFQEPPAVEAESDDSTSSGMSGGSSIGGPDDSTDAEGSGSSDPDASSTDAGEAESGSSDAGDADSSSDGTGQ